MKRLLEKSLIVILLMGTAIYLPSCKKEATLPIVTTTIVTDITQTTASAGGIVMDDGGAAVINRGVTWATTHNPTIGYSNTRDGEGTGPFLSKISGLSGSTTYYVRAFATNNAGTGYGNEVSFKSDDISLASLKTLITSVALTTASTEGKITSNGGTTITEWGFCWSINENPTIADQVITMKLNPGEGIVPDTTFTGDLTGLTPGATYYVRAFAINSVGTAYGNQVSFTVKQAATLTTTEITSITAINAVSGGNITNTGGGEIIRRGILWGTNSDLSGLYFGSAGNDSGNDSFVSVLNDLTPGTTYYVKAYIITDFGQSFGQTISFTTPPISPILFNPGLTYGSVSDIDGNEYKTIQIGTQEWMAENLKTTKYADGKSIPNVTDFKEWSDLTTDAYCWYKNNASAYRTYGALYNWYTVNTGKLCPSGWHVPSQVEWTKLFYSIGVINDAGEKMKESGTTHWISPNTGATNSSGFTALPAGTLFIWGDPEDNSWSGPGSQSTWWDSSANSIIISYDAIDARIGGYNYKQSGSSVRCLKDN